MTDTYNNTSKLLGAVRMLGSTCSLPQAHSELVDQLANALTPKEPPMDPTDPKPCPFCGAEVFVTKIGKREALVHWVQCQDNSCALAGPYREEPAEAVRAWNSLTVSN